LQEDGEERPYAEPPQPEPNRQNARQQGDERSKKAMRVLVKDVALPQMHRKQKQVVAVGGRPIGHGLARFVAGHQAAKPEQQKSRSRSDPGEPVEPGMAGGASRMASMGCGPFRERSDWSDAGNTRLTVCPCEHMSDKTPPRLKPCPHCKSKVREARYAAHTQRC